MTVRSSPMPPTSCGARTAFGCSRWTTAGVGYSPPSSIGTPSASAGMCASEATASPPFSRSPWALRGCMTRPPPVRLGGWPCGWITAPSICRTTSPTRSSSGASSRPTPSSPSPRPTASPSSVQSHAQGTDRPWQKRIYRNIVPGACCGTPSAASFTTGRTVSMSSGSSRRTTHPVRAPRCLWQQSRRLVLSTPRRPSTRPAAC